jgi:hypothetical protein
MLLVNTAVGLSKRPTCRPGGINRGKSNRGGVELLKSKVYERIEFLEPHRRHLLGIQEMAGWGYCSFAEIEMEGGGFLCNFFCIQIAALVSKD